MTAPHSDPSPAFWRCSPGRRLPPYARDLADARARDLVPALRQVVVATATASHRSITNRRRRKTGQNRLLTIWATTFRSNAFHPGPD